MLHPSGQSLVEMPLMLRKILDSIHWGGFSSGGGDNSGEVVSPEIPLEVRQKKLFASG